MTEETVTYQGRRYHIGQDPRHQPMPLPDFLPTVLPAGWASIDTSPWTGRPDPAYARAYTKYGTALVLLSCAMQTDGKRWLHLSVSRRGKDLPTWTLMCEVKEVFLGPDRTAIQIHPPLAQYVNIHPACLHLWYCLDGDDLPDFTAGGETI